MKQDIESFEEMLESYFPDVSKKTKDILGFVWIQAVLYTMVAFNEEHGTGPTCNWVCVCGAKNSLLNLECKDCSETWKKGKEVGHGKMHVV